MGLKLLLKSSFFFKWIKMGLYQIIIANVLFIHLKKYSRYYLKKKKKHSPLRYKHTFKAPFKTHRFCTISPTSLHKTYGSPYADFCLYSRKACACISPGMCLFIPKGHMCKHTYMCIQPKVFQA